MTNLKNLTFLLLLTALGTLPAAANTCNAFASYTCSKSTPDIVHVNGTGTTGQSVGILLGSNTFSVSFEGNKSFAGDDLLILAAAPNKLTGTVNGVAFSSLSSFPEGAAMGAIQSTWNGMGVIFSSPSFGYANVGTIGSSSVSITASGIGANTILYAEVVNPQTGKVLYITPNSEAGLLKGGPMVTPEPASLTLMGTGLATLVGFKRRKKV
ncbi:MAG TPA: PEP-CTERM sorting domain-containing protein [Candidatus Sulfotelmatobacter sp.]|nr:PEP-CTERM sorting domain-containing protein [Candidatus Sulfotelmatobacter sp.]